MTHFVHNKWKRFAINSLGIFNYRNRFRNGLVWLAEWKWFEVFIAMCILANSVLLGVFDYKNPDSNSIRNQIVRVSSTFYLYNIGQSIITHIYHFIQSVMHNKNHSNGIHRIKRVLLEISLELVRFYSSHNLFASIYHPYKRFSFKDIPTIEATEIVECFPLNETTRFDIDIELVAVRFNPRTRVILPNSFLDFGDISLARGLA